MKRLVLWTLMLPIIFSLAISAAQAAVAALRPGTPSIADMLRADSRLGPQGWCWREICPGMSKFEDAIALLMNDHTGSIAKINRFENGVCCAWTGSDRYPLSGYLYDGTIRGDPSKPRNLVGEVVVTLPYDNSTFRLGDAIALFGKPTAVFLCKPFTLPGELPNVGGDVYFRNGTSVSVSNFTSEISTSPEMLVGSVYFFGDYNPDPNLPLDKWDKFTFHKGHDCDI